MTTTIQIDEDIRDALNKMKIHNRETYNDVLKRLIEDLKELNKETKAELESAIREIESGRYKTLEEMIADLGF